MPYTVDPTAPLLQQARDRLQAAIAQENQARMAWDGHRANPALQQALTAAQREHREALGWLHQVQRSRHALPVELEEGRDRTSLLQVKHSLSVLMHHARALARQERDRR